MGWIWGLILFSWVLLTFLNEPLRHITKFVHHTLEEAEILGFKLFSPFEWMGKNMCLWIWGSSDFRKLEPNFLWMKGFVKFPVKQRVTPNKSNRSATCFCLTATWQEIKPARMFHFLPLKPHSNNSILIAKLYFNAYRGSISSGHVRLNLWLDMDSLWALKAVTYRAPHRRLRSGSGRLS